MSSKKYFIYLKIEPECEKSASLKEIEEARNKAFETSKKIFKKEIKDIEAIKISKSQTEKFAVMISIDEKDLDDTIAKLVEIEVVSMIDAHCFDLVVSKEEKQSAKIKMEKYLK